MANKAKWNIWRIKNRWARAVVAWAVCPPVLLFLLFMNTLVALVSAAEQFWFEMTKRDWPDLVKPIFRAMLARGN